MSHGLLVRFEAKPGLESQVEQLLLAARPAIRKEEATTAWFVLKFGRSDYGIFEVFPDEAALEAHRSGPVWKRLAEQGDALLAKDPIIHSVDILAEKRPVTPADIPDTKGLLLTFKVRSGAEFIVDEFVEDAAKLVQQEPETTAWFAIRLDDGEYGIFDVFRDSGARFKHLVGPIPQTLATKLVAMLGHAPDVAMVDVRAEKLSPREAARG